jgi:hypothetical protein
MTTLPTNQNDYLETFGILTSEQQEKADIAENTKTNIMQYSSFSIAVKIFLVIFWLNIFFLVVFLVGFVIAAMFGMHINYLNYVNPFL